MNVTTLYNISLNENKFLNQTLLGTAFHKMQIFSNNQKLICEGYSRLNNNILFNIYERKEIENLLCYMQYQLLESWGGDMWNKMKDGFNNMKAKGKEAFSNAKEKVKEKTTQLMDVIKSLPSKIKNAIVFIQKVLKSGISRVSEFIKFIAKLFQQLGGNISEAIRNLGGFSGIPAANVNFPGKMSKLADFMKSNDQNESNFMSQVLAYIMENIKSKSYTKLNSSLNEQLVNTLETQNYEYKDSDTATADKFVLKYKDTWNNLAKNNTLFRMFITKTDSSGKNLPLWKNILISIVGSFFVCTLIPMILGGVVGITGPAFTVICLSLKGLWVLKNVTSIIVRRTITYKQSFKVTRKGEVKHSKLFNWKTILAIVIAVATPAIMTAYREEINGWFRGILSKMIGDSNIPDNVATQIDLGPENGIDVTEITDVETAENAIDNMLYEGGVLPEVEVVGDAASDTAGNVAADAAGDIAGDAGQTADSMLDISQVEDATVQEVGPNDDLMLKGGITVAKLQTPEVKIPDSLKNPNGFMGKISAEDGGGVSQQNVIQNANIKGSVTQANINDTKEALSNAEKYINDSNTTQQNVIQNVKAKGPITQINNNTTYNTTNIHNTYNIDTLKLNAESNGNPSETVKQLGSLLTGTQEATYYHPEGGMYGNEVPEGAKTICTCNVGAGRTVYSYIPYSPRVIYHPNYHECFGHRNWFGFGRMSDNEVTFTNSRIRMGGPQRFDGDDHGIPIRQQPGGRDYTNRHPFSGWRRRR